LLACGSERSGIVLRDTASGIELRRFTGHRGPVTFVQFSPDGKLLASNAYDRTLRLWDVASAREIRRLGSDDSPKEVNDPECAIAFALDGKTVASGTLNVGEFASRAPRTFRVWNVASGAETGSFRDASSSRGAVAFSPGNKILAVAARTTRELSHRISLYDVESGKELGSIEPARSEHAGPVGFLAFSPDGKTLATSSGGPILLWEVATRREVCRFPTQEAAPTCLAFSPTGRLLASGSTDITVLLWDVTGRMRNGTLQLARLSPEEFQSLWDELGGQDVSKARKAIWTLVAADGASVAFMRGCLHPAASPAGAEAIPRLIADLDSPQYAVRTKAKAQLVQLGEFAEPALLEAEKNRPALEHRQRIEEVVRVVVDLRSRPTGERLRTLRAVEILEQIETPEARKLLQSLAGGAGAALVTREAQAALDRLGRRGVAK
jgi:WD40 repeat protein